MPHGAASSGEPTAASHEQAASSVHPAGLLLPARAERRWPRKGLTRPGPCVSEAGRRCLPSPPAPSPSSLTGQPDCTHAGPLAPSSYPVSAPCPARTGWAQQEAGKSTLQTPSKFFLLHPRSGPDAPCKGLTGGPKFRGLVQTSQISVSSCEVSQANDLCPETPPCTPKQPRMLQSGLF